MIRRCLALLLLAAAPVLALALDDAARLGPAIRLAPGVHVLSGSEQEADAVNGGAVGNLGVIETPAGTVLVNTGGSYRLGRALIDRVEHLTGRPVIAVVVTQARPEYVMGMAAFTERGIEVIAHAATARLIATRCAECLRRLQRTPGEAAMRGTRLVAPTRTLVSDTRIAPGGRPIDLLHFGPAQTDGDLVVLDVDSGVAFAGAMVSGRRVPELESAGGTSPWRRALAALAAQPVRVLVPGYGAAGAPSDLLAATDAYLARLAHEVQLQWERGTDLLVAPREVAMRAWQERPQYSTLQPRNVQREYLATEARWLAGAASGPR